MCDDRQGTWWQCVWLVAVYVTVGLCVTGDQLKICSGRRTCCTEGMELQLGELSRRQLDEAIRRTVGEVADDLGSQGSNFDGQWFHGGQQPVASTNSMDIGHCRPLTATLLY